MQGAQCGHRESVASCCHREPGCGGGGGGLLRKIELVRNLAKFSATNLVRPEISPK